MEAAVLLASAIYIFANLLVDIVAMMLDPRLRRRSP
jgi:ABC-type dipeptide/oligopeptide/nickel transport system permease component